MAFLLIAVPGIERHSFVTLFARSMRAPPRKPGALIRGCRGALPYFDGPVRTMQVLVLVVLSRSRRTATGGWVVQLTDTPLDLDNPAHLEALKRAYDRFPEIGRRSSMPL
jgi:hypothetical protein